MLSLHYYICRYFKYFIPFCTLPALLSFIHSIIDMERYEEKTQKGNAVKASPLISGMIILCIIYHDQISVELQLSECILSPGFCSTNRSATAILAKYATALSCRRIDHQQGIGGRITWMEQDGAGWSTNGCWSILYPFFPGKKGEGKPAQPIIKLYANILHAVCNIIQLSNRMRCNNNYPLIRMSQSALLRLLNTSNQCVYPARHSLLIRHLNQCQQPSSSANV